MDPPLRLLALAHAVRQRRVELMPGDLSRADIYASLVEYASSHEKLVHESLPTYFAFALPLAGLSFELVQKQQEIILAAVTAGAVLSAVWYLRALRWKKWREVALAQIAVIESDQPMGITRLLEHGRRGSFILKFTPNSISLTLFVFTVGFICFVARAVFLLLVLSS